MNVYYRLRASATPEIAGVYPQVTLANFKLVDFFHNLGRTQPYEWHANFDQFKFAEGAKKTDLVTCSVISSDKGVIISRKFYELLVQLIQSGITSVTLNAVPMNIDGLEYFLIQLLGGESLVDWENSIFEDLLEDEETLVALSKEEYTSMRYNAREVKLTRDCDLFQLPFAIEIIISGKLKDLIETRDLTGIDQILPFDWFLIK